MDTRHSVSLLVLLAFAFARANECPHGCGCKFGQVTCSGLTSFPTSFPVDTVSINIAHMNADEIPIDCLDNMEFIKHVFIQSSTIFRVRSGAFNGHDFMEVIRFDDVQINTIESFAFNNIVELGTLAFYESSIENIEMFAFSNMYAFKAIEFNNSNITYLATKAFYNLNEMLKIKFDGNSIKTLEPNSISGVTKINELSVSNNVIDSLGCGNVEKLLDEAYTSVIFMNTVTCSCNLLWLQNSEVLTPYLGSNWCKDQSGHTLAWNDISNAAMACSATDKATTHCTDLPEAKHKTEINSDYPHQEETTTHSLQTTGTSMDGMDSQTTNSFTTNAWDVFDKVEKRMKMAQKDKDLQKEEQTTIRKDGQVDDESKTARDTVVSPKESFNTFGIEGNKRKTNGDETVYERNKTNVQNDVGKKRSNTGLNEKKGEHKNTDSFAYAGQSITTDENSSSNASKGTETRAQVEVEIMEDKRLRQSSMTSALECVRSNYYVVIIVYVTAVILYAF